MENALGRFGVVQRTVAVKREPAAGSRPQYTIVDEQVVGNDERYNRRSSSVGEDGLKKRLGTLVGQLPAGF